MAKSKEEQKYESSISKYHLGFRKDEFEVEYQLEQRILMRTKLKWLSIILIILFLIFFPLDVVTYYSNKDSMTESEKKKAEVNMLLYLVTFYFPLIDYFLTYNTRIRRFRAWLSTLMLYSYQFKNCLYFDDPITVYLKYIIIVHGILIYLAFISCIAFYYFSAPNFTMILYSAL